MYKHEIHRKIEHAQLVIAHAANAIAAATHPKLADYSAEEALDEALGFLKSSGLVTAQEFVALTKRAEDLSEEKQALLLIGEVAKVLVSITATVG